MTLAGSNNAGSSQGSGRFDQNRKEYLQAQECTSCENPPFLLLGSYALLLTRDAFGGAIRYYADIQGAGILWYLPDILLFLFFVLDSFRAMSSGRGYPLGTLLFFAFFAVVGFISSQSILSVLSAIKMFVPFFVGLYAGRFREKLFGASASYWVLFLISIAGILWSQQSVPPWTDYLSTNAFGVTHVAANQRWIEGVARLAGFASDSTAAGYVVMLCAILLMRKSPPLNAGLIACLATYPLYLTTSRTAWVGFFVYVVATILERTGQKKLLRSLFVFTSITFFVFPFILPLIGGGISVRDVPTWATSMIDRIHNTWVSPFAFMWDQLPFGYLSGLGLGAVAFPIYYSPVLLTLHCADNFMLANYLMFGIVALVGTVVFLKKAYRSLSTRDLCVLLSFLVYGITIQGYGASTYVLIIGLLVGTQADRPQNVEKKATQLLRLKAARQEPR